jgi:hypothetical protein
MPDGGYLDDQLLSLQQAAEILGIRPETLRKWKAQGVGPAWVLAGPRRRGLIKYRREDLLNWIMSRRVVPSAEQKGPISGVGGHSERTTRVAEGLKNENSKLGVDDRERKRET